MSVFNTIISNRDLKEIGTFEMVYGLAITAVFITCTIYYNGFKE